MPSAFPCACFNTVDEEMFEVTWYFVVRGEFVSTYIALYMHRRMPRLLIVQKRKPQTHRFTVMFLDALLDEVWVFK